MKTLIVVAHPHLGDSTTQAFLRAASAGVPDATWHPLPPAGTAVDVAQERALLHAHQRLIFQFPLLWYQAPAALTDWLAAVWPTTGAASAGELAGHELGLVVSFSQAEAAYQLGGSVGVALSTLLSPFAALAERSSLRLLPLFPVPQFAYQPKTWRQELLVRYQQFLTLAHPGDFAEQAAWWQAQLAARGPADALLAETLAARQAQLAQLRATLRDMKAGDDG